MRTQKQAYCFGKIDELGAASWRWPTLVPGDGIWHPWCLLHSASANPHPMKAR